MCLMCTIHLYAVFYDATAYVIKKYELLFKLHCATTTRFPSNKGFKKGAC